MNRNGPNGTLVHHFQCDKIEFECTFTYFVWHEINNELASANLMDSLVAHGSFYLPDAIVWGTVKCNGYLFCTFFFFWFLFASIASSSTSSFSFTLFMFFSCVCYFNACLSLFIFIERIEQRRICTERETEWMNKWIQKMANFNLILIGFDYCTFEELMFSFFNLFVVIFFRFFSSFLSFFFLSTFRGLFAAQKITDHKNINNKIFFFNSNCSI